MEHHLVNAAASSDDPDPASRRLAPVRPRDTPARKLELVFQNPSGYRDLALRPLRSWMREVVAAVAPWAGSLGVLFAGDRRLAQLNLRFRAKNGPTDVLSFPGEDEAVAGGHLGDIAISVPTARRQAQVAGHSLDLELKTLILHGIIHCLGYDHETDQGEMDRLEADLRVRWISVHG